MFSMISILYMNRYSHNTQCQNLVESVKGGFKKSRELDRGSIRSSSFDNGATSKIDDVLFEHAGLL